MKKFNPTSNHPNRAVQAWQILISAGMNRQTLTYKSISLLMYRQEAAGVLGKILGHIAYYCIDNNLPPLTLLVVNKNRGTPGYNIPINKNNIEEERENVYAFDWYNIYPPTSDEFLESFNKR